MRNLRIALAAALLGVVATLLPTTAHAVDTGLYSFRACAEYGLTGSPDAWVCLKTYAARQPDGSGWRVNSIHVYAWSEGNPGSCGASWEDLATSTAYAAIDNDNNSDGITWGRDANLGNGNGCDLIWQGDPLIRIKTRGVEMTYTYHARINGRPDPDGREQLRVFLEPGNSGGILWHCTGNLCTVDGPY